MNGSGMELEQVRETLATARRLRDAATSRDSLNQSIVPLLVQSLTDLITVTESLLGDRQRMESRLHRTPFAPADAQPESGKRM